MPFVDFDEVPLGIDASRAHPARRYDYWLGGKDNFVVDRESAKMIAGSFPTIRMSAIENRRYLHRVVRFLAGEAGIRQFLDVGAGLPSAGNVHEIAQEIAPESCVVYVDNDPIVLVHARALLRSTPEGRTAYLHADLRDPGTILSMPDLKRTIDLDKPVALMLLAVLHFLDDDEEAHRVFRVLREALPSGSYIALSHASTDDLAPDVDLAEREELNRRAGIPFRLRHSSELAELCAGLELVEPGVSALSLWRPNVPPEQRPRIENVCMHGLVARVP
ncbi:SAM-dependent methyltransferase [Actinocorallia sp. API 0066]|uniref:SAM-dependent methyltransferase n=1 Tax=Actinocorallia sp. API 0066 TaxID=2896846 RepID=UPI001E32260B|nr:SAM-dependent methyltransferase [Actinocorallia sp. API 0066]MCD0449886.1 SAM-dependent methyltransferase [Actinocorallia sp. API 0066]